MSTSPFRSDSWEPRFVVEHYGEEAALLGVQLWLACAEVGYRRAWGEGIRFISYEPALLQAAHPQKGALGGKYQELAAPLSAVALTDAIFAWLRTAAYPERPNFDGGEAHGFTMFWSYYGAEDGHDYGSLVVLPKWIELHK